MIRSTDGVILLLVMALTGCAAPDPREEFGYSVRHMIGAQIHDPAAANNPLAQTSQGLAGDKAAQAMKAYRSEKPLGASEKAPVATTGATQQ